MWNGDWGRNGVGDGDIGNIWKSEMKMQVSEGANESQRPKERYLPEVTLPQANTIKPLRVVMSYVL